MTTTCIPFGLITSIPSARGKYAGMGNGCTVGAVRLPTDPLYYAALTLNNIAVGSRYRAVRDSDGTLLAEGEATGGTQVLSNLPGYETQMLTRVTVRKGTSAPKYQPGDFYGYLTKTGGSVYVAQIPDNIA